MPKSEDMPSMDFEEIMQSSGLRSFESRTRIVNAPSDYANEIDKATDQIICERDYEESDPKKVADYRDFVARSWREHGYSKKRVAKLRLQAMKVINGVYEG